MQIFMKKFTKLDFLCPNKNWWLVTKYMQFQHILRKKKVQEIGKNTPIKVYEDNFLANI